jgi:multidrug efflux pump subunit AcrA (membrane-fusion protein)
VDGRAVLTPIKRREGGWTDVEILHGLKEGDTVIVGPLEKLKDGDVVEPRPAETPVLPPTS